MFDARAAKALGPGDHLTVDGAPGLRLVATASRRTWTYRYRSPVDGRMRQIRLGHWPAMSLPAALAAWERVATLRAAGQDPAQDARQRKRATIAEARATAYTVRRACAEYLDAYASSVGAKTHREARRLLAVATESIADRPAASITRADAFEIVDAMRDRPVMAMRLRQTLGAVWDRALDAGRLPPEAPNWWRLVLRGQLRSRGKVVRGEQAGPVKRVLTGAEVGALLGWLHHFSADVSDVLTLYLWTCCRGAEIVGMERREIVEEADGLWWVIPRGRLKMRRNQSTTDLRVPLVGRAEAIVRRRLEIPGRHLFPSPRAKSGHIGQGAAGQAVWFCMPECTLRPEIERERLPVTGWAPHDLRRTSRTLLAALGCPSEVAEAILGHVAPGVVGIYNRHGYDAERRVWLTRLSQHLETLSAPAPAADR
jgi:integrase